MAARILPFRSQQPSDDGYPADDPDEGRRLERVALRLEDAVRLLRPSECAGIAHLWALEPDNPTALLAMRCIMALRADLPPHVHTRMWLADLSPSEVEAMLSDAGTATG